MYKWRMSERGVLGVRQRGKKGGEGMGESARRYCNQKKITERVIKRTEGALGGSLEGGKCITDGRRLKKGRREGQSTGS